MNSRRQPLYSVNNNSKPTNSVNSSKSTSSSSSLGLHSSAARKSLGIIVKEENSHSAVKKMSALSVVPSVPRSSINSRYSLLNVSANGKTGPRGSIQCGRDSINSRRLSIFGGNDIKYIQDPRPIKDRFFMQSAIQKLIQYLTCYNYEKMINNAMLISPSKKDFFCILEFLFRFIDPNFQWSRKEEDEAPVVFKILRYPFQLSSRSLSSVGTPHTWPTFLGALHWLVNLLIYNEKAQEFRHGEMQKDACWSSEVLRESFFMFTAEAYSAFMTNNDNLEHELETKFSQNLLSRNQLIKETLIAKEEHTRLIKSQINNLVNSETRISSLERQIQIHEKDISKYQKVIDALEDQISKYANQIEMSESIVLEEQQAIDLLTMEIHELEERLFSQLEQNLDVDRLNQEHRELEQAINITIGHRNNIENHTWNVEMAISEQFNLVEEGLTNFNQLLRENDMLSKFGGEMRFNPHSIPMFSFDLTKLKPELKKFLEEIFFEYTKYQQTHFLVSSEAEKSMEDVSASRCSLQDLKNQLQKENTTLEKLRRAIEDDKKITDQQISELRSKAEELIFDHWETIRLKEAKKNSIIQQIEDNRTQAQYTKNQLVEQIKMFESLLVKHKKYIEDILKKTLGEFEAKTKR